ENVVLVNALSNLLLPESSSPQFVRVAAFCHHEVAKLQPTITDLVFGRFHLLHVREIEPAVFDIRDAKIRDRSCRTASQIAAKCYASCNFRDVSQPLRWPSADFVSVEHGAEMG